MKIDLNLSVARCFGAIKPDIHQEPSSKEFFLLKQQILEKNEYRCVFCDWVDNQNQIHHLNDDHDDNEESNLVPICALCHSCCHIGESSKKGNGILIHCPDISQVSLNHLMRIIFVIMKIGNADQKKFALAAWNRFQQKSQMIKKEWGTANPELFAKKLILLPNESYQMRGNTFFNPVRILFTPNSPFISKALPNWTNLLKNPSPDKWIQILQEYED